MIDVRLLHPTHLLYNATVEKYTKKAKGSVRCPLCGFVTEDIIEFKPSNKFTNYDIFRNKENATMFCPACVHAIKNLNNLNKVYFLTDNEILFLKHPRSNASKKKNPLGNEVEVDGSFFTDLLSNPPQTPWVLMFQPRMKGNSQHTILNAKVNYGIGNYIWVSEAKNQYAVPTEGLSELIEALKEASSIPKLTPFIFNNIVPHKQFEYREMWEKLNPIIEPHKNKHYFNLLYDQINFWKERK